MFEALQVCLSETLESFTMKIFLYAGLFNWVIVIAVFVINGKITLELIKKMRKIILYAFAIISVPFIMAVIRYLQKY